MARLALLRECFDKWKNQNYVGVTEEWAKTFHVKQAIVRRQLNDTAWRLRKQLQADRKAFLASICDRVKEAKSGDVFRMLRPLIGTSRQHGVGMLLPQVNIVSQNINNDGQSISHSLKADMRWIQLGLSGTN